MPMPMPMPMPSKLKPKESHRPFPTTSKQVSGPGSRARRIAREAIRNGKRHERAQCQSLSTLKERAVSQDERRRLMRVVPGSGEDSENRGRRELLRPRRQPLHNVVEYLEELRQPAPGRCSNYDVGTRCRFRDKVIRNTDGLELEEKPIPFRALLIRSANRTPLPGLSEVRAFQLQAPS